MDNDSYNRELLRATRVAFELSQLLRKDATLFKKIKPRTLRWIKKQEKLERARKDAKDEVLRLGQRRREALAKLTRKEKELLGLEDDSPTDD